MTDFDVVVYPGHPGDEVAADVADLVRSYRAVPDDALIREVHIKVDEQTRVVYVPRGDDGQPLTAEEAFL